MEQNSKDVQKKFKEIVAKLPEDKKKALYERLKGMDAAERNDMIAAIVEKETEIESKEPKEPQEEKGQQPKPQQQKGQKPQQKPQQRPQQKGQQGQHPQQKPKQGQHPQKGQPNKGQPGKGQPAKQNQKQPPKQADNKAKQPQKQQPKPDKQSKPSKPANQTKPTKDIKDNEEPKDNSGAVRKTLLVIIIVLALGVLGFTAYRQRASLMELWGMVTGQTTVTETSETTEATTAAPTNTPTPTPSPSPTPTPVPIADDAPDLTDLTIVIDPGHQQNTSEDVERVASWLSAEKSRCTSGGEGVSTGIREYDLTLRFSVMLKEYLEGCGAKVIMTREVNDVDLSNQERAQIATAAGCNLFIRIHADSANDAATSGIQMYVPNRGNYYKTDKTRGEALGNSLSEATGLPFNGVLSTEVYTGLNYATSVHSIQVSLGYLTNSDDEAIITDEEMQYNMVVLFAQFCKDYKR